MKGVQSDPRTSQPWRDPTTLRRLYVDREMSLHEVGDELGCSYRTVHKWLKRFGIQRRSQHEPEELRSESWLRTEYLNKGKTSTQIGEDLGVDRTTVLRWIRRHGIEHRYRGADFAPTGEDSHLWKGGHYEYGPGWTERRRERVRERDGRECVSCGLTESEQVDQRGEKLHVHHIEKPRQVRDPEQHNAMSNLVSLCRDCHVRWERLSPLRPPNVEGLAS